MTSPIIVQALAATELRNHPLRTQDDCCALAARVAMMLEMKPWTDELIFETAASMAAGVFGPAYEAANYGQRTAWIDMCERAIRSELKR
jgi:hypothetical protein